MNPLPFDESNTIDALVRSHLDRQAARVDGNAGLARVRAALGHVPHRSTRHVSWGSRLALAAGILVCVGLALLIGTQPATVQASSRDLLRQTRIVHQSPIERCYMVAIRREPNAIIDQFPLLAKKPTQVRIWTCGDRFWVEMKHSGSAPPLVWGREKDGALWAVLGPRRGVRAAAESVPAPLTILADVHSLNVDTLLDNVLADCTLTELPAPTGSKGIRVVRAVPRSEKTRRWLGEATLEIDTREKVLRQLKVARNRIGVPFAEAVFTFVETRPADHSKYQLESHLRRPFRIHQGNIEPAVKLELLARWFGIGSIARQSGDKSKANDRKVVFKDVNGKSHTPLNQPQKKATVLFFVLPDCPISNAYAPEIKRICADYESKKVSAYLVHADPDVSVEDAKKHAREYGFSCSVLLDPAHILVKRTGVTTAPEVAVIDPEGKVVYRGRIDDWYVDYGQRRAEPTQRDLRNALDAVLTGKPVAQDKTKALGCPLPDPKK